MRTASKIGMVTTILGLLCLGLPFALAPLTQGLTGEFENVAVPGILFSFPGLILWSLGWRRWLRVTVASLLVVAGSLISLWGFDGGHDRSAAAFGGLMIAATGLVVFWALPFRPSDDD